MKDYYHASSDVEIINAAQSRDFEKIRSLRQADEGVVINCDEKGHTAFHWAAFSDDVEVFNALTEGNNGYLWECRTSNGMTTLHVACANNSIHIVKRIIEIIQANSALASHINEQNAYKETALHLAAAANNPEIAQILLDGGADVSILDQWNRTARRVALENGDTVLAALLPVHANDDLASQRPVDATSDPERLTPVFTTSAMDRPNTEGSQAGAAASMLSYRTEAPQKWDFQSVTQDVLEALKSGKEQTAAEADGPTSVASSTAPAPTTAPAPAPTTSLHQSVLASSPNESYISSLPPQLQQTQTQQKSPQSALAPAHLKLLHKLSQLANIGPERLAYEIVLNPYYRLPTPAVLPSSTEGMSPGGPLQRSTSTNNSNSSANSSGPPSLRRDTSNQTLSSALSLQDPATWLDSLRRQMLRVMGDKLINSLRRSPVVNANEVAEGQVIPVYFMPNDASPEQATAGTGSDFFTFTKTPVQSARVLALRRAGDASALDLSTQLHQGDAVSPDQVVSMDVQYIGDGVREDNVSVKRIVLSGSFVPDPTPLVMALQDLAMQIASFTPNRLDIQQAVLTTVDAALLSQMIVNRALDPATDLLPILQFFQRSLMDLQAPSRTASTEAWIRQLTESFYKVEPVATGSTNAVPSSGQRRGKSIDEVAHLLPPFFERATSVVEEIQRDMANYYITVLVPVLHQKGHAYLRDMFQAGIQEGVISLDGTASLLFAQLLPDENFQATVRELIEAGACPEGGFSLEDILPSAVENEPRMLNGAVVKPSAAVSSVSDDSDSPAAPAVSAAKRWNLVDGIVARSMLYLMQLPVRLDTPEALWVLPETLMWDASRLATMRDLVDRIALECSLVIATKQVIGRYQLPSWCSDAHAEVELQHRLDVLLSEKDTSLASITVEVSRYVQEALHKFREAHASAVLTAGGGAGAAAGASVHAGAGLAALAAVPLSHPALVGGDTQEVHERVTKALKDVVAQGNPVLALFSKRVYKVLLRAMLGQEYKHLLPSYSLSSPAQQRNLSQLLLSASRLFSHTMGVHRDIYTVILGRAVATAAAPVASTDSA